jgi:hypothetical protein
MRPVVNSRRHWKAVQMDWPGVKSRASREALLRDLATGVQHWTSAVGEALRGDLEGEPELVAAVGQVALTESDIVKILDDVPWAMSGMTHSALVTLDGGSSRCPTLELRDPQGRALGDALHEEWPYFDPLEQH